MRRNIKENLFFSYVVMLTIPLCCGDLKQQREVIFCICVDLPLCLYCEPRFMEVRNVVFPYVVRLQML